MCAYSKLLGLIRETKGDSYNNNKLNYIRENFKIDLLKWIAFLP